MYEKETSIETKIEFQELESRSEINCFKIAVIIGIWIILIFTIISMFKVV